MKAIKPIAKEILASLGPRFSTPLIDAYIIKLLLAIGQKKRAIKRFRRRNSLMTTQEVFDKAYRFNEWGGKAGEFYSGSGSKPEVAASYCEMVRRFIADRGLLTVVDLGCGDFRVGAHLQVTGVSYLGIDIVPELIDRNRRLFENDNVGFMRLDMIIDRLPDAELCLIRQVFQHLSNDQICEMLKKITKYPYVLITEHYPADSLLVIPNLDKPHGGDTRLLDNSAVFLDQPPFNVYGIETILEVKVNKSETIRTMLIDRTQGSAVSER